MVGDGICFAGGLESSGSANAKQMPTKRTGRSTSPALPQTGSLKVHIRAVVVLPRLGKTTG